MIPDKEIKHIANLARLDLSAAEFKKYGEQLGKILDYVGQLTDVDTSEVDGIDSLDKTPSNFRPDEVVAWNETERDNALHQASEISGGQIKVHRVLE